MKAPFGGAEHQVAVALFAGEFDELHRATAQVSARSQWIRKLEVTNCDLKNWRASFQARLRPG